jgi:hypothetical protein
MPPLATSRMVVPSPETLRFLRARALGVTEIPWCIRAYNSTAKSKRPAESASFRRCYSTIPSTSMLDGAQTSRRRGNRIQSSCIHHPLSTPTTNRCFSTSAMQSRWRSFWKYMTGGSTTRRLPPLASFLDASTPRQRLIKAANEPRLRCTEFDEKGNVTLVNGEFKKSELIAKVCIRTL